MRVGFLGFGEVASTLSAGLMENGADIYTCIEGRSTRTRNVAEKAGVKTFRSYKILAENSDILISSVVPSNSVEVAEMVGKYTNGIYVDINNVSPKTVKYALSMIENGKTVDAAIIGSVVRNGVDVKIIASGPSVEDFAQLKGYGININVVGSENGQASGIKLLRSAYTKGVSALLFESIYNAYQMGIDRDVLKYISETECPDFRESAVSRIISAAFHAERRSEEMAEVIEMLSEKQEPIMARGTAEFFKMLSENIKKPERRPDDYLEIFKDVMEIKNHF
jgi:3-hydroxyisobutyrate dehydrogenase-like beta-hydroxyacid dehydrogenase